MGASIRSAAAAALVALVVGAATPLAAAQSPAVGIEAIGSVGEGFGPAAGSAAGDVDGDGRDDVVQAGVGGTLRVMASDGATLVHRAGFDTVVLTGTEAATLPASARLGDFDGDDRTDVLVVSGSGAGRIWRSDGTAFRRASPLEAGASGLGRASELVVADFDGDGRDDLLQVANGRGYFWLNRATGGFSRAAATAYDESARGLGRPEEVRAGDFDGDGRADLLQIANGRGYFWLGRPPGGFSRTEAAGFDRTAQGIGRPEEVLVGDLDADGTSDLTQLPGGLVSGAWMWPSSGADFGSRSRTLTQCAPPGSRTLPLDIDGDHRTDFLLIDDEAATAFLWRGAPMPGRGPLPALTGAASRVAAINTLQTQTLRCEGALRPLFGQYYPSESAIEALSLWRRTDDPRHLATARRWLRISYDRAHRTDSSGLSNHGMLIVLDPNGPLECRDGCFGRDYQARQIYDFYIAAEVLDDLTYLRWAEEAADAMRANIPRVPHQGLTLFAWNIDRRLGERDQQGWTSAIDPNQNAEIALAFALLATDDRSIYRTDPARRSAAESIVANEMAAGLTQQRLSSPSDPDHGAIALSQYHPGRYDTAYGSYTAWSWAWVRQRMPSTAWDAATEAAGHWLASYPRGSAWGLSFQPPTYTSAIPTISSAEEVWYRAPALLAAGRCDLRPLLDQMLRQEWPAQDPAGHWDNGSMLTVHLELMGVPESTYLEGTCS